MPEKTDVKAPRRRTGATANGRSLSALGDRLRQARTERGLSLRELARRLDVSPSLLSQIETGKIHPSVRTLYAIVDELDVMLHELFAPEEQVAPAPARPKPRTKAAAPPEPQRPLGTLIQRADDRQAIDLESGVRWERLTPWTDREVEFNYSIYDVGGQSSPEGSLMRHNGREFGVVIRGHLGVTVGFDDFVLGPGDSIAFESSLPHRLHNDGDEPVHAIWMVIGRYHGSEHE